MVDADFTLIHAGQLLCIDGDGARPGPRRGVDLAALDLITDGAVAARNGTIVWVGPTDGLLSAVRRTSGCTSIDAAGRVVTPGLIDAHTHPVFAATRPAEFAMRAE
ncbi:MAG TPA: imidazolonepropionase, partial [Acidobacteriota bacterium]|nr:imidazolonepropionase [Acidobacteriota bacterium]